MINPEMRNNYFNSYSDKQSEAQFCRMAESNRTDTDSEDSGTVCGWEDWNKRAALDRKDLEENLVRRFSHLFKSDLPAPLEDIKRNKFTSFAERKRQSSQIHPNSKLPPNCGSRRRYFRNSVTPERRSWEDLSRMSKSRQTETENWFAKTAPSELERYSKMYDLNAGNSHCNGYYSKSLPYLDAHSLSLTSSMVDRDFHSSKSSMSSTDSSFKTSDYEGSFEDSTESLTSLAQEYESDKCDSFYNAWISRKDFYDRKVKSITADFGRSKSDTALDRLFSEIPENLLKYRTATSSSIQNSRKCRRSHRCSFNKKRIQCKQICSVGNLSTKDCTGKHSKDRSEHMCCNGKTSKKSCQSLECIPKQTSFCAKDEQLKLEFCERKYNTLKCSRNSHEATKSPNMIAAKGKVKDLIQRFSSMETLRNGLDSPAAKQIKTKLAYSKTGKASSVDDNGTSDGSPLVRRTAPAISARKACGDDPNKFVCDFHGNPGEIESPFTRMIKRVRTEAQHSEGYLDEVDQKTMRKCISPKNKSPVSITACNNCGSKDVKEYQFCDYFQSPDDQSEHGKINSELEFSDNSTYNFKCSDTLPEKTNSKPYIQLKSLRSWRDASKSQRNTESKSYGLVENFQNKIRSGSKAPRGTSKDLPVTFSFENISRIEDSSASLRRLSFHLNSPGSLKFDPLCSSRWSDVDLPPQDYDGSHNHSGVLKEKNVQRNFGSGFKFNSIDLKSEENKGVLLNCLKQRRYSLPGVSSNSLISPASKEYVRKNPNFSVHPTPVTATSPTSYMSTNSHSVSVSENSNRGSPPYFSTWNFSKRNGFGSKSTRM